MDTDEFPTFGLTLPPQGCDGLVGCVIHDRYELLDEIGEGGFGCVFRARQKTPARLVAVKVSRHDAGVNDRMVREADVLATFDHPAIARVYDANKWDSPLGSRVYVVMELVPDAERFHAYCLNRLPRITDRMRLFIRVCEAVGAAHDRGIVHRDLKPGNVLVSGSGQPKVIDFGIAKILESENVDPPVASAKGAGRTAPDDGTKTGMFMGTAPYAPPEQMAGEPVTPQSDVYALGKMLEDVFSDRPGGLPTGLRQVVDRCTRPDQQDRYADATQLAGVLDRWLRRRNLPMGFSAAFATVAACVALWIIARPGDQSRSVPQLPPVAQATAPSEPMPMPLRPIGKADEIASDTTASDAQGRWFVAALQSNEVAISLQNTPQTVFARPRLDSPAERPLAFDATGDHLAAHDGEHYRVWKMTDIERDSSGRRVRVPESASEPPYPFGCLALSADGTTLYGQTGERSLVAMAVNDGRLIEKIRLPSTSTAHITTLCRGPDPKTVFFGTSDGTIIRWAVGQGTLTNLDGPHGAGVAFVVSSLHGDRLASLGADEVIRIRSATGMTVAAHQGPGKPQALTLATATRVLVASRSASERHSRVTRYDIQDTSDGIGLVVTGTAAVPESVLSLEAGGASFLAVTLDRQGGRVTEVW